VALVPLYALLGITDEISAAACGLMLGLSWLLWPRLFGPARWHGAVVLIALAAAILLANRFLAGTIAAGGPVEHAHWMPPRIPHFFGPPLPFRDRSDWEAWWQLFVDEGTLLLPAAVLAFSLLRDRRWNDPLAVLAVFGMGAMVLGLAEYLSLEVNGRTYEGHRFMTAARILIPLAALAWAPRLPRASLRSIALLAPICVGAVAAVGFVYARFAVKMDARGGAAYDAECRTEYGARLGERIVPTYVDEPIWYPYAGCRPIFAAGHDGPPGVVLAGWAKLGPAGFAKMDHGEVFTRGAPARVVCAADPAARTPFCQRAVGLGPCRPAGTRAIACEIPPEARPALEH
jgi:hypothetical protein